MTLVLAALALALSACGGGAGDGAAAAGTMSTATAARFGADLTATSLAADASTWTFLADEGQHYSVSGTQTVRFGAGERWITTQVTGDGDCTNSAFGSDPAPGVYKRCEAMAAAEPPPVDPGWTTIADEGEDFSVGGTQTVRFGAGDAWISQSVSAGGSCTNGYFGSDPAFGVRKSCQLATATTPPPPPPPPPSGSCSVPVAASDTSGATATVGDGSAASCTEGALRAAVDAYGVVKFDCGAAPVTIQIAATIVLPPLRNTVIDGGNRVTLDGGGATRIFSMKNPNFRTNSNGLTLQHIALRNARAPGGGYVAPNPANPACASGYASGGGAAIEVLDARLHVFDVDFGDNAAASPGPDVGGGAIYAAGSLDVLIAGSRFSGNSGSNSGAVGMLQSNLRVYNSSFTGNTATGTGQNYAGPDVANCPGVGHPGQGGSGGNGGAIFIDGSADTDVIVCGSTFTANRSNELAGALGRTANIEPRSMLIDRSAFIGNVAKQAGALYLQNVAPLTISATTISGNQATVFGGVQLHASRFEIVNTTFANNVSTFGIAGALYTGASSASSVIRNATFAGNRAAGGAGYFAAAMFGDSNFAVLNTVFSNNTTDDPWNPMQCGFTPLPGSGNLQWPRSRPTGSADNPCVADISFADPLLGALAANGGTTQTLLPAAASPLRQAGRDCPPTDQRGNPRNATGCTIGAVE